MQFTSISSVARYLASQKSAEPIAIVIAEDAFGLGETVNHLEHLGFKDIVVISDIADLFLGLATGKHVLTCLELGQIPTLADVLNLLMPKVKSRWIHACYNGEFLFYPFAEFRPIQAAINFASEERRDSIFGTTLDAYANDIDPHSSLIPKTSTFFDSAGYFGTTSTVVAENQAPHIDVYGGLRWRFSEYVPEDRRKLNRRCLFRVKADLKVSPTMDFNFADYNSVSSKWHNSMTMAVVSFRLAKALRLNPSSATASASFEWQLSEQFAWSSDQLLKSGFIEPGQWF